MELMEKYGYKQTEVGRIPKDWELVSLDDVFTFYSTSSYSKAQMSEYDEIGCIHYGLIHAIPNSQYNLKDGIKYYVSKNQAKYEFVKDGDVIMVDASEDLEGVNKSVEVFGIGNQKYISGLHTYLLRDKNLKLADNFRGILLNSKKVKNQMLQLAVGMKVFGVSKTQLINVLLPLPTLEEQKAIATALSDVDELITNLDKLITKKKAIKQGAMQQLLTPPHKGGKRLKGFTGDWEEKRLGEIAEIYQPITISQEKFSKDGYPVYGANGVVGSYIKYNHKLWQTVITCRGSTCGTVNRTVNESWITGNAMVMNVDNQSSLNKEFFYHLLFNCNFISCITGSGQPQIVRQPLFDFIVSYPENLSEQIAIATMLSDMDLEIEQLESKKIKYQSVKQGMMQELLTGKTRLT